MLEENSRFTKKETARVTVSDEQKKAISERYGKLRKQFLADRAFEKHPREFSGDVKNLESVDVGTQPEERFIKNLMQSNCDFAQLKLRLDAKRDIANSQGLVFDDPEEILEILQHELRWPSQTIENADLVLSGKSKILEQILNADTSHSTPIVPEEPIYANSFIPKKIGMPKKDDQPKTSNDGIEEAVQDMSHLQSDERSDVQKEESNYQTPIDALNAFANSQQGQDFQASQEVAGNEGASVADDSNSLSSDSQNMVLLQSAEILQDINLDGVAISEEHSTTVQAMGSIEGAQQSGLDNGVER